MKLKTVITVCLLICAGLTIVLLNGCSAAFATEPVSIKIYPEHVGVFTSVGEQQFITLGTMADGTVINLTQQCDWFVGRGKDSIATINAGLVKLHKNQGRTKVEACYPSPCVVEQEPDTPGINMQPVYSILLDKVVSTKHPEVDIPEPEKKGGKTPVGRLSDSTSLTAVNVTEFVRSGDVTKWPGAWPATADTLTPTENEVYLYGVTITPRRLAWESTPYKYPYDPFPNTIAAMISAVWSMDKGKTFKLQSWDYLTNTRHDKGLEHGMPDCWMGTMVHTLCDRKAGECNGRYRSNLYFTEYPVGNKNCWSE